MGEREQIMDVYECFEKLKTGEIPTPTITFDTNIEDIKAMKVEDAILGLLKMVLSEGGNK